MLIAHVERAGVWRVTGGMQALATALANLAASLGVVVRTETHVESIDVMSGRAAGVRLADGEFLPADAVVMAGDAAALSAGLLGDGARGRGGGSGHTIAIRADVGLGR